ncbi:Flagellar basal-body rod protein FlgG [hydrothermal vent metagenome]|uniref:Flagellar basal-body rod protein FlgG n=1 Tax=hydrothermal vent metagenome TaxID=652676 RepID=A0A3B1DBM9_9ZZZZ
MHEGIYIAASGAFKQERKLDVIANNLANMGTTGFKRDGMSFREMIPPFTKTANSSASLDPKPTAFQPDPKVSYVGIASMYTDASNGTMRQTGNALDLALDGDGYFVIETSEGQRYTRNGNLKLAEDGTLSTHEGFKVLGKNSKPIKIDTKGGQISISPSGAITVGNGQQSTPQGDLQLVSFRDPTKLAKQGNGLYRIEDPSAGKQPIKNVSVQQGFLETSNVNPIEEMTNMIVTMRGFEAYQKIIQSIDEADEQAVNAIGRLA